MRKRGFTLGKIITITKLPKTTVYDHIKNIPLSPIVKAKIRQESIKRINYYIKNFRKGKCMFGRVVVKPEGWTKDLIFLVCHFMFDGEIRHNGCIYNNRNIFLINRVKTAMKNIFNFDPKEKFYSKTGVHRISYFYVELADYMHKKSKKLIQYIKNASLLEKKVFLQSFFDDEGCAYKRGRKNLVRGYQHNLKILLLVQKLLKDFGIKSKIDKKYQEIIISKKENFIKFRDNINFSKEVFINPDRSNSIWKQKLEKREILNIIINSYKK